MVIYVCMYVIPMNDYLCVYECMYVPSPLMSG